MKSIYSTTLLAGVILNLSACSIGQHPKVDGMVQPVAFIATTDTAKVIGKLSEVCDRHEMQIDESTANSVTCSWEAPLMAQALLSTKYGSNVRSRVRFNAIPTSKGTTKITTTMWYESQNAFGQVNKRELTGGESGKQMQVFLDEAKAELEGK